MRVLIVDDEKSIRVPLGHFTEGAGHSVVLVASAEDALAVLADQSIDIVISDILLGGLSGLDLLREVHQKYPHVLVVLITGEPSLEATATALRYHAFDLLAKPITRDDFLESLGRAVDAVTGKTADLLAQAIAETSVDSIFCKDTDYRYTYVNPHMAATLGRSTDELVGKRPEEVFSADDAATVRAVDARCFAGETVNETHALAVDGQTVYFHTSQAPVRDAGGRIVGECGIVRDVTALQTAERVASESSALLAAAEAVAHMGSWRWNLRTGHVTWSDELKRIWGVDPEAFGGEIDDIVTACIHPEDRERVQATMARVLEQGDPLPAEYRVVRPDGTERIVYTEGRVVHDSDGGVTAIQGCAIDVTERRHAERALQQAQARLVQTERFAAIGRVSTGVAHELSEPLAEIVRLARAVEAPASPSAGEEGAEVMQQALGIMRAHAERCLSFVEELEGEVRQGAGEVVLVDVCHAVRDVLDARAHDARMRARSLVRERDRVTLENLPTLVDLGGGAQDCSGQTAAQIRGVAGQFERILGHLLDNALDATAAGDSIVVGCRTERDGVVVTVADSGEGIEPERIKYIFEPFYSTRHAGGQGFGLYFCRRTVESMGGLIACQSAVGVGTVMRIWIPLARPAAKPTAPQG